MKSDGLVNGLETPSTFLSGPGTTPMPASPTSSRPRSICVRDARLEHRGLEVVAVDEEWSEQGLEAVHADLVEHSRPQPSDIELAGLNVGDGRRLEIEIVHPPFGMKRDRQCAARADINLVRERVHLVGVLMAVVHCDESDLLDREWFLRPGRARRRDRRRAPVDRGARRLRSARRWARWRGVRFGAVVGVTACTKAQHGDRSESCVPRRVHAVASTRSIEVLSVRPGPPAVFSSHARPSGAASIRRSNASGPGGGIRELHG